MFLDGQIVTGDHQGRTIQVRGQGILQVGTMICKGAEKGAGKGRTQRLSRLDWNYGVCVEVGEGTELRIERTKFEVQFGLRLERGRKAGTEDFETGQDSSSSGSSDKGARQPPRTDC